MTDHIVNGKPTQAGDKVRYTARDGQQHEATIDNLHGTSADLTATVNGTPKKFTTVQHSTVGGVHTWDHAPSQGRPHQGSQLSPDQFGNAQE